MWRYVAIGAGLFALVSLWFGSVIVVAELSEYLTESMPKRSSIVTFYVVASMLSVVGSLVLTPRLLPRKG